MAHLDSLINAQKLLKIWNRILSICGFTAQRLWLEVIWQIKGWVTSVFWRGLFLSQRIPVVANMTLPCVLWTESKTKTDRKVTLGNDQCWSERLLPPALLEDSEEVFYEANQRPSGFTVWARSSCEPQGCCFFWLKPKFWGKNTAGKLFSLGFFSFAGITRSLIFYAHLIVICVSRQPTHNTSASSHLCHPIYAHGSSLTQTDT